MRPIFLTVGLVLPPMSTATYIVAIIKGRARPHRTTRLLLLVISFMSWVALTAANDNSGVWLALISTIQALVIWVLSLRKGVGGRERFDITCFALCVIGIILWFVLSNSFFGLVASLVADVIAVLPSLRKTIRWPETEVVTFFVLDVIASIFIILASPITWRALLFPAYIAAINAVFVAAILWPRKQCEEV